MMGQRVELGVRSLTLDLSSVSLELGAEPFIFLGLCFLIMILFKKVQLRKNQSKKGGRTQKSIFRTTVTFYNNRVTERCFFYRRM